MLPIINQKSLIPDYFTPGFIVHLDISNISSAIGTDREYVGCEVWKQNLSRGDCRG